MNLIKHMFQKHRIKFFTILTLIAVVSVYFVFRSQAATDKYWVGGCSDDTWACSDTGPLVGSVDVGIAPIGVVTTSDGAFAYVANSGDNTVSVVDTAFMSVIDIIFVATQPQGLAITPDDAFVYVANAGDTVVSVIDTSNNSVTDITTGGANHHNIAITPDGAYAYVTESGNNSVVVIEISSNTVVNTILVGILPQGIAITPDGAYVYVVNSSDGTVSVIDTSNNSIVGSPIVVGTQPQDVAITPDGVYAYVTNLGDSTISIITTASNTVTDTILSVGNNPYALAITPDGAYAYISNANDQATTVIEISSNTVFDTISTGYSNGITITSDGAYAYTTDGDNDNVHILDTSVTSLDTGTNWSLSSGGVNDAAIPDIGDNLFFDANSVGNSTIESSTNYTINSLDMTGYTGTLTQEAAYLAIEGDTFIMNNVMTYSPTTDVNIVFSSTTGTSGSPTSITTGSQSLSNVVISGPGGYFQLQDELIAEATTNSQINLESGTFDANDFNVTTKRFISNNADICTLTVGSGIWSLTGSSTTVWDVNNATNFTLNRGSQIELNYSGGVGTRSIIHGVTGGTEANSPDLRITAGSDIINTGTGNAKFHNLDFTGFSGSLNNNPRTIYGDLTISPTMTLTSGSGTTTFAGTTGTQLITSNGKNFNFPLVFNGLGGIFRLVDNLDVGTATNRNVTLTAGTIDLNGNTLKNFGSFTAGSGSLVRVLDFNGGTYENIGTTVVAPVFSYITTGSNFTTTGIGTIKISGVTTNGKQLTISASGGLSLPDLWWANPTAGSEFRILGNNITFTGLKAMNGVAQSLKFNPGTTTNITSAGGWDVSGTAGNLLTIDSTGFGSHTISIASGVVESDYLDLSNSIASGTPFFYAGANSIDGGGNTGWIFTAPDSDLPDLTTTSITSTDTNGYAQTGDTVTISFTADEAIQTPTTAIFSGGNPVASLINTTNISGNDWEASYVVDAGDTLGLVTFTIDYQDLIGNPGVTGTTTTDASSVIIGEVPVTPVIESNNTIYGSYTNPAYKKPTTTVTTSTTTTSGDNLPFTHDLFRDLVENDVRLLQQFLNTHGFIVSETGFGSPGNETNYFGPKTEQAVIRFQQQQNITPAVGYFGPKTRAVANSLI